jgi:hypothetical protein
MIALTVKVTVCVIVLPHLKILVMQVKKLGKVSLAPENTLVHGYLVFLMITVLKPIMLPEMLQTLQQEVMLQDSFDIIDIALKI